MSIFLSNEIIAFLVIELIILVLMGISEFEAVRIMRFWDFSKTSSKQYKLEKKNYLINTILFFAIISKIILFIFFIRSLNELANIVPGAMCSAGVIGANVYGNLVLLIKIILIFGFGAWLIINKLDLKASNFPFIKKKYALFSVLFALVILEFILEILFFNNIPLKTPVFCCSVAFSAPSIPLGYSDYSLVLIYYSVFLALVISNLFKQSMLSFFIGTIFLVVGFYAITYFFGTYVYELPNHKCPYCFLQKEYYYIGYAIWGTLFLAVFYASASFIVELIILKPFTKMFKYSSLFAFLNAAICTFYVARYYILTGTLL